MDRFAGTTAKCKSCEKTVYIMEQLVADGVIFHKHCFRCNHCKRTLGVNDYASLEGVVYCKPHFHQLFKKTGSYNKSFDDAIKAEREHTPIPESITGSVSRPSSVGEKKASPFASRFQGTQEKCVVCSKTVYPLEKISVENTVYHNSCFKCFHGGCKLTLSTYAALDGKMYCKHHFSQLFKAKGNYSKFKTSGPQSALTAEEQAKGSSMSSQDLAPPEAPAETAPAPETAPDTEPETALGSEAAPTPQTGLAPETAPAKDAPSKEHLSSAAQPQSDPSDVDGVINV